MEDHKIIDLFFKREEEAIAITRDKYGRYCNAIAVTILKANEDAEECENDTYLKLWETIPPSVPQSLRAYIGTVVRNLSIQKYRYYHASKRNQHMECIIEEIEHTVSTLETVESEVAEKELIAAINVFLGTLRQEHRMIFVRRYWHMEDIPTICKEMHLSKSNVETTLSRIRKKLKEFLAKEGYHL